MVLYPLQNTLFSWNWVQNICYTRHLHTNILCGVESLSPPGLFSNKRWNTFCITDSKNSVSTLSLIFCCYFTYHSHFQLKKKKQIAITYMKWLVCCVHKSHAFFPTVVFFTNIHSLHSFQPGSSSLTSVILALLIHSLFPTFSSFIFFINSHQQPQHPTAQYFPNYFVCW